MKTTEVATDLILNKPLDYSGYMWNEENKKDRLVKRLMDAYKKRRRKKKIEKLRSRENHWKGLE